MLHVKLKEIKHRANNDLTETLTSGVEFKSQLEMVFMKHYTPTIFLSIRTYFEVILLIIFSDQIKAHSYNNF